MKVIEIAVKTQKNSKRSQTEKHAQAVTAAERMSSNRATSAPTEQKLPEIDNLRHLDIRAPRYTSYPTADRFIEAFGPQDYARHLSARALVHAGPLSVYVHIPFCESLCYYCACNKTITRRYEKAPAYVQRLLNELQLVDEHLVGDRQLSQMHWGGGTPTYLRKEEISVLMRGLREHFELLDDGEYSIEIDPRAVDGEKIELLASEGFNRMSLGVQDFDPDVQRAINRLQPVEQTRQVLEQARAAGFTSTNFDLIYGLPLQTVERYARTMEDVIEMRPERIALYNYAHLPARFKAQRHILDADLPSSAEKFAIFEMASEKLYAAGYEYIGMDHFAVPDDELAVAHRTGRLHRNFQGYSTRPDSDLIALGASSISRVGACYSQNLRGVSDYTDRVSQGQLPTMRGIELTRDDVLRRAVIMAIMCQGHIDKKAIEIAHLVDFDQYFVRELAALRPLEELQMVQLDTNTITITEQGRRKALRVVAATFDHNVQANQHRQSLSRVL